MKLLDRNKGLVKVVVETADDLWFLHTIIDKGDRCTGDSEYKYKVGGNDAKAQVIKKRVWVQLAVDKTEFSASTGQLRINGKVTDGSEEVPRGSFHSLDISEGSRLTIEKTQWLDYQLEKLDEALHSARLNTLLVLFDRENAIFALLKANGYDILLILKGDVPKKGVDEGRIHSFYKDVAKHLEEFAQRHGIDTAIAASPSFWKEYLEKELGDVRKKVIFATVSTVDETAISEILRRPELEQALKSQRTVRELKIIESMLGALAKDRLVYGHDDLRAAISEGNIGEVLVSEAAIMKAKAEDDFESLETLLRAASDVRAKVHLLSTAEAAAKVDGFGGIVGIKRW